MTPTLTVAPEVRTLAPDFTHLAVEAHGLVNGPSSEHGSARTVAGGEEAVEHPEPGEVVWCDDEGVTCRRWNWRRGVRTRLTEESVNAVFLLESLAPTTRGELDAAGTELAESLERLSPGARVRVHAPV